MVIATICTWGPPNFVLPFISAYNRPSEKVLTNSWELRQIKENRHSNTISMPPILTIVIVKYPLKNWVPYLIWTLKAYEQPLKVQDHSVWSVGEIYPWLPAKHVTTKSMKIQHVHMKDGDFLLNQWAASFWNQNNHSTTRSRFLATMATAKKKHIFAFLNLLIKFK